MIDNPTIEYMFATHIQPVGWDEDFEVQEVSG